MNVKKIKEITRRYRLGKRQGGVQGNSLNREKIITGKKNWIRERRDIHDSPLLENGGTLTLRGRNKKERGCIP